MVELGSRLDTNLQSITYVERSDFEWFIGDDILEVVDQFCYFEVKLSKSGLMNNAVSALHDKALRALSIYSFVFIQKS